MQEQIDWYNEAVQAFETNLIENLSHVQQDIEKFEFHLTIHDEAQKFRDYNSNLFNYPYQKRISRAQMFTFSDQMEF